MPVPKKDGAIRLCGDYKVSVNPWLQVDQYPLPNPSELMTCLTGGQSFTKLDLQAAYQQMSLDEESRKLVTLNTHQGLYECNRLPFGIASAPAVFQRAMDAILQGIPHVICYLDDILITGRTPEEHIQHLEEVLRRLQKHGMRLKKEKCCFFQDTVEYLGHRIDAQGIHVSPNKVRAVLEAPSPKNVSELRSFLGMINYYSKFLPNLSSTLHPLHLLLRVGQHWKWTESCEQAFQEVKRQLTEAPVLVHYDPRLPLVLAADASAYGVGAVLSHRQPDGTDKPIAFMSRTLTPSERNYAQVEREALALVFGIQKFHLHIYGRHFTLQTDHKLLTSILAPKNGIPPLAAARMQRWALMLSAYSYSIEFRPTSQHANADGLSRLPLPEKQKEDSTHHTVFNVKQLESLPVTTTDVRAATRKDTILSKVFLYLQKGWPRMVPKELLPYWRRREGLTVEGNCLLLGYRVVVPTQLRKKMLDELHTAHPGVVRMKTLARSHMWWPCIDQDIEDTVKHCEACQKNKALPAKAPLHPWAWPTVPWERVHVDFVGPFLGKMFFIAVDSHSKWPEVVVMQSTTASKTITVLREMFSRNGVPCKLVSDNGPQFVAEEFRDFMAQNGVKHVRTSPYHPASNGMAERLVQTLKRALMADCKQGIPLEQSLASFLLKYRTTPHATTGVTPCSLFFKRELRTRLHLLSPNIGETVRGKQMQQKGHHDQRSHSRELGIGQTVWVKTNQNGYVGMCLTAWDQCHIWCVCLVVSYGEDTSTTSVWV